MTATACASGGAHPPDPGGPPDGVRLLYEARIGEPDGSTTRFRLAVAFRPPDQIRLEALGPAGGTRLVIATDGVEAIAILPADRRFDRSPAGAAGLGRWTGVPLSAADLGSVLQGGPPCGATVIAPGIDGSIDDTAVAIACTRADGEAWARRIAATPTGAARSLLLERSGEPQPARFDPALFRPDVPAGFRPADLSVPAGSAAVPLLQREAQAP